MAPTISPVNESSLVSQVGIEKDSARQERSPKSERLGLNEKLSTEEVEELIEELNDTMRVINTKLSFSVDNETKRPIIKVTDRETEELIRQIPPEELLKVSHKIHELMGILFDARG